MPDLKPWFFSTNELTSQMVQTWLQKAALETETKLFSPLSNFNSFYFHTDRHSKLVPSPKIKPQPFLKTI